MTSASDILDKETKTLVPLLRASSFEIERGDSISDPKTNVSGNISVDEEDEATFAAIKELCSKENVNKVIIVYRNFEFALVGVSLTKENKNPPSVVLGRNKHYKFHAKDVHLEMLSNT